MAVLGSYKSRHTGQEIDDGVDKANNALNKYVTINGKHFSETGAINLTKSDIGLANAQNTADIDKEMSNPTKNYVDGIKNNLQNSINSLSTTVRNNQSTTTTNLNKKVDKNQGLENKNKLFLTNNLGNQTLSDKLPTSFLPDTGISVDSARVLVGEDNQTLNVNEINYMSDKGLYNLGYYDSIEGNTITRRTGYIYSNDIIKKLEVLSWDKNYKQFFLDAESNVNDISETTKYFVIDNSDFYTRGNPFISNSAEYTIGLSSIYFVIKIFGDIDTVRTAIAEHPFVIQYQLKTPYEEKVIANYPILNLDQTGTHWLEKEWKRGLNIVKTQDTRGTLDRLSYKATDNKIKVTGTANLNLSKSFFIPLSEVIEIGTVFSAYKINKNYSNMEVSLINSKKSNSIYITNWESKIRIDEGCEKKTTNFLLNYLFIEFPMARGDVEINEEFYVMANEGSIAYPYQPYSGAIVHTKELSNFVDPKIEEINRRLEELGFKEGVASVETSDNDAIVTTNSLKKIGSYVIFNLLVNENNSKGKHFIAIVPKGFRPKNRIHFFCMGLVPKPNGEQAASANGIVDTDGVVMLQKLVNGSGFEEVISYVNIMNIGWETN